MLPAMFAAVAMTLAAPASAQAPDSWQLSDSWRFGAAIYGYFPDIGVKATLPTGVSIDNTIGISQTLDHLKMAFFGALEVQKGPWGAFTDVLYMDVGGTPSTTRSFKIGGVPLPVDVTASTSVDLKAVVWTTAGSYRVMTTSESALDVFAGARLLDFRMRQDWALTGNVGPIPVGQRTGSGDTDVSVWDAIAGVKGRVALNSERTWFVPFYLDIGTGDSKLTWQAIAGVGYAFGWGNVLATWRYLDYRNESGKPLESLNMSGPQVTVAFPF